jgi:UDP-N-acetylmuramoylalanine--D-glutamate ligase
LIKAQARGVKLSSDLELFLERRGRIDYAITRSDGKSTTTHLIASILEASGKHARPTGNYGVPLSTVIDTEEISVAELSSFQLNFTSPKVTTAVITGITPNHLNWHTSLEEYVAAKRRITDTAKRVVADTDSELMRTALEERRLFAAVSTSLQYNELSTHVRSEHYLTYRCGVIYLDSVPLIDISGALRHELYNVKNYMLAAGSLIGTASAETVGEVIRSFRGLAHRAQLVAERDGIKYYDSSVDSTPERTLATLRGIRGRNAVIIAGKGKRLSLFKLSEELPRLTVGCVLMGKIGEELSLLLSRNHGYKYLFASDMQSAVTEAAQLLGGEGNVILSPAGTSFDVYKNFEERGRAFCSVVKKTIEK